MIASKEVAAAQNAADYGAFIPSQIDDYPLDPFEFRVYCHITRRAGRIGCIESHKNMAKHCQMSFRRLLTSVEVLTAANIVSRTQRPNGGWLYTVNHFDDWVPASQLEQIKAAIATRRKDTRTLRRDTSGSDRGVSDPLQQGGVGSASAGVSDPLQQGGVGSASAGVSDPTPKGTPIKVLPDQGTPIKVQTPLTPQGGDGVCSEKLENFQDLECRSTSDESQKQGNTSRKKQKSSGQIELRMAEKFENFKFWYKQTIMGAYAPGRFGNASLAKKRWAALEKNNFHGYGIDGFRRGCKLFHEQLHKQVVATGQAVGVPNVEQFVQGTQYGCPGHWQAALIEELEAATVGDPDEFSAEIAGIIPSGGGILTKADRAAAETYRRSYELAARLSQQAAGGGYDNFC